MKPRFFALLCLVFLSGFSIQPGKTTVYLIGDSTMASKSASVFPETGWGMPFSFFFDSTVVVDNRAQNGRSTRTFISENLWAPVVKNLKSGDYVFIQFGHNDEVKEKTDRYTTPDEFRTNLRRFISETRTRQAIPVLITPVARRKFTNGRVVDTHTAYSALVREIAKEQNTTLIDLDEKSRLLLQQFGEENSKLLFLHMSPGEHPNYPKGKEDNTHFSELGARKVAQIVLSQIIEHDLELSKRIVNRSGKP